MSNELNKAPVEQAGGDERAAFEAWLAQALSKKFVPEFDLAKYEDSGEYRYSPAAAYWKAWQARAALAQPSPVRSSLLINGYQLRAAMDFIAPDGTAEQLGSEACIEWRQQDADFLEAGLYAFCAEYPEEGGVLLDEEPTTAQPSPLQSEQAEAERPEVAEVAFVLRSIGAMDAEDIDGDNVDLRFEDAEGRDTGCDVSIVEYAEKAADLFEQHDRIVGELRSERDAANARLHEVATACATAEQERDAALARVAELESKLAELEMQAPVAFLYRGTDMGDQLTIIRLDHYWRPKYSTEEHDYIKGIPLYAAPVAQAQHSVPEGYALIPVRETEAMHDAVMALLYKGVARSDTQKLLDAYIAAAPAKAQHSVPGKYDDVLLPFLKSMEHELHANAGKGDRPGWLQMDRKTALLEIYYHLGKLQKATKGNDTAGIVEYAADVANMSMMLVDVCGLLADAPGKEVGHE
ncbi:hypothetical protein [Pseudomonas aeruginosa]|uniref:hypothetical protein n=1 Tax=Pseudomonas aeruginosa TaxID=287 RepID=UPI002887CEF0|nr:hypothetical protein [Pseudomonas aeruginosa]MDT0990794.1 hypothetical protein [Pseudomonas aeruginosa]